MLEAGVKGRLDKYLVVQFAYKGQEAPFKPPENNLNAGYWMAAHVSGGIVKGTKLQGTTISADEPTKDSPNYIFQTNKQH